MVSPVLIICFIIILILVATMSYNVSFYNSLIKDTWCCSPIILMILLGLSLVSLTTSVFINYKDNIPMIPIYFMIMFFEIVTFIAINSRMFLISVFISAFVFLLTGLEIVFSTRCKNPELFFLICPFFFYSLVQTAICDNLYKHNFDHIDILNAV